MPISTITYFSKIFADRYAICTVEHRKEWNSYFGAFSTKSWKNSPCLSVRPHETTQEPLNKFLWNLILGSFIKICQYIPVGQQRRAEVSAWGSSMYLGNNDYFDYHSWIPRLLLFPGYYVYLGYPSPAAQRPR
jgi:hypothetical protein